MPSTERGSSGFTLLELLAVFAVAVTILALGIPALNNFIVRSKTEGFARETAVLLQRARLEAIKQNRDAVVYLDTVNRGFAAFLDADLDGVFNPSGGPPADYETGRLPLPSGVLFQAPPQDGGPVDVASVDGLSRIEAHGAGDLPAVIFQPNGSVAAIGAFRIGDERGNFLEIRVEPEGTGKVEILKADDNGVFHPAGDLADPDYQPWEWK